jgi:sporulation protein YlmC with PRC-barrel domain
MDPKLGRTITLAVACSCLALFGTAIGQQQQPQSGQSAQPSGGASGQQQGAQQGGQQQSNQQQGDQSKKGSASGGATKEPVAGVIKLGTTVIETEAIAKGFRASKLIGRTVKNDMGQNLGKIEDLVISPDGKVTMAVLEVGGFLEIGERRVAIPIDQFSTLGPNPVLPGATKTALKDLPAFKYAKA